MPEMILKDVECPYCHCITDAIKYDKWIAYKCCGVGNNRNNDYDKKKSEYLYIKNQKLIKDHKDLLFKTCGMPDRYKHLKFKTFPNNTKEQIEIINICMQYISNYQGKFLTMYGLTSTGKTAMASIIMKYIINKNSDIRFMCKFINENELINEIVGFNQKEIYQKYINYDLLVIDELGLKGGNEKIFSVIDGRYNKLKSTIITTNIDLTKTQDKILFRISERCFQSPNIVLYFNGESLRKNNNNNSSSNSNNNDQDKYIN